MSSMLDTISIYDCTWLPVAARDSILQAQNRFMHVLHVLHPLWLSLNLRTSSNTSELVQTHELDFKRDVIHYDYRVHILWPYITSYNTIYHPFSRERCLSHLYSILPEVLLFAYWYHLISCFPRRWDALSPNLCLLHWS